MLLNTDLKSIKFLSVLICTGWLFSTPALASEIDCNKQQDAAMKKICATGFDEIRKKLSAQYQTAFFVSDAPLQLLQDTHSLWLNRLKQCKSIDCYKQQFELRIDDLNIYTSLNQSLTTHYLKFSGGKLSNQPVHIQVHQLSKDNIKIEGLAYRNPNNRKESQTIPFLAYTASDKKNKITDNEHDCAYDFKFSKAILAITTEQKGCERFSGIYRLYD